MKELSNFKLSLKGRGKKIEIKEKKKMGVSGKNKKEEPKKEEKEEEEEDEEEEDPEEPEQDGLSVHSPCKPPPSSLRKVFMWFSFFFSLLKEKKM